MDEKELKEIAHKWSLEPDTDSEDENLAKGGKRGSQPPRTTRFIDLSEGVNRKAKFLYDDTDSDSDAGRSSALKRDSALHQGVVSDPSYSNFTNLKNTKLHINDHIP